MDPVPGEDDCPVGSHGSCGTEEGVLVVQKIHVSYLNNTLKLK